MKRKYMIPVMASLLAISACDYNEDNFEGFEDLGRPTNVMKINYKLTDADYNEMSSDVKANKYFTSTEEADNNIPGWLAEKYFTADQGSTANITYRMKVQNNQYSDIPYLTLAEEDYNIIHGEGYYAPYLNAGTEGKLYEILKEKMPDATEGTYTFVEYQYSENGVPQQMDAPIWQYNFEDLNLGDLTSLDGWFIQSSGDEWEIKEYSKNKYAQFTANYAEAEAETWLITPAINIEDANKKLSWDVTVGYWKADCLSVYIVEDFDGKDIENAKKTDVTAYFTIPQGPTGAYGTMTSAGVMSLDGYSGKSIRVAFHYAGNKKEGTTTTYQVDNIVIGNDIPTPVNTELRFALYEKESKGWYKFTNTREAIAIPYGEYTVMGEAADDMSFSSQLSAEEYRLSAERRHLHRHLPLLCRQRRVRSILRPIRLQRHRQRMAIHRQYLYRNTPIRIRRFAMGLFAQCDHRLARRQEQCRSICILPGHYRLGERKLPGLRYQPWK